MVRRYNILRETNETVNLYFFREINLCEHHTVWKFQDNSVIHILREISFGESLEDPKMAFSPDDRFCTL